MMNPETLSAEMMDMAEIAGEAIGWQPLAKGAYLHLGDKEENVITIVGVADASMASMHVLLLV